GVGGGGRRAPAPDRPCAHRGRCRAPAALHRSRLAARRRPLRRPAPGRPPPHPVTGTGRAPACRHTGDGRASLDSPRGGAMTFLSAPRLLLLAAPVALLVAYVVVQRTRRRLVVRFTSVDMLASVAPRRSGWQRHIPAAALLWAVCLLVLGFAHPAR